MTAYLPSVITGGDVETNELLADFIKLSATKDDIFSV